MAQNQVGLAFPIREISPDQPPRLQPIASMPPLVLDFYQEIPEPCLWNLADILKQGVRHEENIYGYLNSLLTSIFLTSQRFQVNPQYPLRPRAFDHETNVSVGSTGEMHSGRKTKREEDMLYPDFLITKPSPRPRDEKQNRINAPIAIIEVKKLEWADDTISRMSLSAALNQVSGYALRVLETAYAIPDIDSPIVPSYLIYGKYYGKVTATVTLEDTILFNLQPLQHVFEQLDLNAGRAPLAYRLCELAVRHWNSELDYEGDQEGHST